MHLLKIFFPANNEGYVRVESMFASSSRTTDVLNTLRFRGTLHSTDSQLDIEEDDDILVLNDIITGDHIVSVML